MSSKFLTESTGEKIVKIGQYSATNGIHVRREIRTKYDSLLFFGPPCTLMIIWYGTPSQVHYVQKITFVQNLWRLAKLYIFEKFIMSGIRKLMFTFAQTPKWPPFWIFKMAAVKYEYSNILSFYWHINLIQKVNPVHPGPRN